MTRFLGNLMRWFLILFWIVALICLYVLRSHAAVPKQANKPPDIFHYVNPKTYQLGTVAGLDVIHPVSGKTWTVVTWKPAYAPMLYSEYLLFCGEKASELFVNLTSDDQIVIVYSRAVEVARIDSPPPSVIACHSLDHVVRVNKEQNQ